MHHRLEDAGVEIRLNCPVDVTFVKKFGADHVIVATGSQPLFIPFPGLEELPYFSAHEVLRDSLEKLGERVLIIGGGLVGSETAEYIAKTGRHVSIAEMEEDIARDIYASMQKSLKNRLAFLGVTIHTGCRVEALEKGYVKLSDRQGQERQAGPFDSVVLALGSRADHRLSRELSDAGIIHTSIGDCAQAGKILQATADAMRKVYCL